MKSSVESLVELKSDWEQVADILSFSGSTRAQVIEKSKKKVCDLISFWAELNLDWEHVAKIMSVTTFFKCVFAGNMAPPTALSKSNTSFALALFKELADNDRAANIFYSPFSISSALAMVLMGAGGNTATQMSQVRPSTSASLGKSSQQPCRLPHPLEPGWKGSHASGHHECV